MTVQPLVITMGERSFLSVDATLDVISNNSRGLNACKKDYLANLLLKCDILFVQEHWLFESQLDSLNSVSSNFFVSCVSGFTRSSVWWLCNVLET